MCCAVQILHFVLGDLVWEAWRGQSCLVCPSCCISDMESLAEGRITLSAMELSTIEELGASDRLMAGMVDYGRMLEGVEVAISLWEQRCNLADGGDSEAVRIKLSLRSTGRVDVAAVAKQLGGGGHRLAAGASLTCGLQDAVQQVVALVCAALAEV